MALRIYWVALEVVAEVYEVAGVVERKDKDLARQLRRASSSVVLNVGEGQYSRKGNRASRYQDAMASANETRCGLQVAERTRMAVVAPGLMGKLDHVVATLWKLTR